jgi:uncharacterized GH25 family protein
VAKGHVHNPIGDQIDIAPLMVYEGYVKGDKLSITVLRKGFPVA